MRDIAIVLMLPILLYTGFKRPFIALGLWLWSSAFNINQVVYGFAASITFAKLFAGLTIMSFFLSKEKSRLKFDGLTIIVSLFYIIATLSNVGAIGDADASWERWGVFSKILLFYFFAIAIISKKIHFEYLIWILVISIGAMSAKEGVKFVISGGNHRIGALLGIMGDNNFFGVMITTVIPLAGHLVTQTKHKLLKIGIIGVIIFMILGIFATFSRGAFLGLFVFTVFFLKNSKRKILWLILLVAIGYGMTHLMSEAWLSRMGGVEHADSDESFMGRVVAWKIATLIAMDHFLGGGFNCFLTAHVWAQYSLEFSKLDFIPSPYPPMIRGYFLATHSSYFQVLANHGFIGLFLFLIMLLVGYLKASKIIRVASKNHLDDWVINLAKMLKLSLVAYCVSGAAVNVAYMDFLYAVFAMIAALDSEILTKMISEKVINTNDFTQKKNPLDFYLHK
jgi:probable O-glycosylation ligase (exosortase A-associated)